MRRRTRVWMNASSWRHWWRDVRIAWALLRDHRVPMWTKVLLPAAWLLYFFFPLDLLPDLIPFLGEVDDLMLFLLLVRLFIALSPAEVVNEIRQRMERPQQRDVIEGVYRIIDEEG